MLVRSPSRVATKKLQLLRSTGIPEAISLIATVHLLKLQPSLLLKTTGIMRLQIGLRRCRRRPYRVECTGSLSTSEVKQHRARLVLGWGTAWEDLRVLSAFCMFGIPSSSPPPGFLLGLFVLVHSVFFCASSFYVVVLPPMS